MDGQEKAELPGGAAVEPGRRHIQVVKGGAVLLSTELELPPGGRVALDALGVDWAARGR